MKKKLTVVRIEPTTYCFAVRLRSSAPRRQMVTLA